MSFETASEADLIEQYPTLGRETWLNHAAISPWPRVVIEALERFVADNASHGPRGYRDWLKVENELRDGLAALLGHVDSDEIALVENTSAGLNLVAGGLDWRAGDRVVIPSGEFPSNRLPWIALRSKGIDVVEIDLPREDPETALTAALTDRTRVLSVSAVRYDDGTRLDLERLGRACRRHGTLLCVDAIQQVGAFPLDPVGAGVDFLACGAHKWLLCPEGIGFFWARADAMEQLQTSRQGWRSCPKPFDFDKADWQPAAGARRFEIGTLNMAGIHALNASVTLILDTGPDRIARALGERVDHLYRSLKAIDGVEIGTPADPRRRAGIISFSHARRASTEILRRLAGEGVHAAVRGSHLRLSPHFYTPMEALDRTIELIADL